MARAIAIASYRARALIWSTRMNGRTALPTEARTAPIVGSGATTAYYECSSAPAMVMLRSKQ